MAATKVIDFPLFNRAEDAGLLADGNGLIVAPTATGKSYIGRTIIREAVARGESGVHVYLVPYRALASEMHESFKREFEADGLDATIRLATGDYTDPIHPESTDVLVATYERFSGLLGSSELLVGRLVVDELHMVADPSRGTVLEGLFARLKAKRPPKSICALSAVIQNPEELGDWLGIRVVLGDSSDRAVAVEFVCEFSDDVDGHVTRELQKILKEGEQAIIFCNSKAASQKLAKNLKSAVSKYISAKEIDSLQEIAADFAEDDEELEDLSLLLSEGATFHNAGLSKNARRAIETAFRKRVLKVIACTPTLSSGVNLPARLVVVRDVFRTEFVRGFPERVVLPTGELLNMLGRAGRPGQVEKGRAVALVRSDIFDDDEFKNLRAAISAGKGDPIKSQLPNSFDSLMRFLLAVAVDWGEATLADLGDAIRSTLWFSESPEEILFDRSFREDMMEDIPSFSRVSEDMYLEKTWLVADGVAGSVVSGNNTYDFALRFSGVDCTCPAKAKWRKQDVCKHLACAIHDLLFNSQVDAEIKGRAIYACVHSSGTPWT